MLGAFVMTFEEWMRRPIYRVQCVTWKLGYSLFGAGHQFRSLPQYRDEPARLARLAVARYCRENRAAVKKMIKEWKSC